MLSDVIELIQASGAPGVTTDKLYNVSGQLFWNGNNIGTAGISNPVTEDITLAEIGSTGDSYQIKDFYGNYIRGNFGVGMVMVGVTADGTGDDEPGYITIQAGGTSSASSDTGASGAIQIRAGNNGRTTGTPYGGTISLQSGSANAAANGVGGNVNFLAGSGSTQGGSVVLRPGRDSTDQSDNGYVSIKPSSGFTGGVVLRFEEDSGITANFIGLKAPTPLANDRVWTLPDDDPATVAGQFITTDASGVLSFAAAGGVQNPMTANLDVGGFDIVGSSGSGPVEITGGASTSGSAGGDVTVTAGAANSGSPYSHGGDLTLKSGAGSYGFSYGGDILIESGTNPTTGYGSGHITIQVGNNGQGKGDLRLYGSTTTVGTINGGPIKIKAGTSSGGNGGAVSIDGGNATSGSKDGGAVNINGGVGGTTGDGGVVEIYSGNGGATSGAGGDIKIYAGDTNGSGSGNNCGDVILKTGGYSSAHYAKVSLYGSNGTGIGRQPSSIIVNGGDGSANVKGGDFTLYGGTGGSSANGGDIKIFGGYSGAGGSFSGYVRIETQDASGATAGDITLAPGGGSTDGSVLIRSFSVIRSAAPEIRMYESGGGAQYVAIKAPDSVSSNALWTIPEAQQSSGDPLGIDLGEYLVANLPSASAHPNCWVLVTDRSGGTGGGSTRSVLRSDGTAWKLIADEGATVS